MTDTKQNPEADDRDTSSGFIEDVQVNFRDYRIEDFVSFVIFWVLGAVVFAQFFSRYVLNDSIAWTEEIARYLLIAVAFAAAPIAVRKNTHIHVEFFYRFINRRLGRFLSVLVDLIRIVFFAYGFLDLVEDPEAHEIAVHGGAQRLHGLDLQPGLRRFFADDSSGPAGCRQTLEAGIQFAGP